MGLGGSKIELTANADSPSGGGHKVVLSNPLDQYGLTEDKFWELFAKVKRGPLILPSDSPLSVVKHETTDLEGGGFRVVDTIGGFAWGESQVTLTHTFDKDKHTWTTTADRDPTFNKVTVHFYTRILQDPLRLESWAVNEAARLHGPALAGIVDWTVKEVLKEAGVTTDVQSKADQDSPSGDGKKSITLSLQDALPVEKFWEVFDLVHRRGLPEPWLTSTEVQDTDDGGFRVTKTYAYGAKVVYVFHKKTGDEWTSVSYDGLAGPSPTDADKEFTFTTKVHRDPFVVEVWSDVNPKTTADEGLKALVQGQVDALLAEAQKEEGASSGGGWFG